LSVAIPVTAIVFGSVAPSQSDVIELSVHLGCTKEVSSYEVTLQNWGGKYSPNGPYPITVGLDGSISVGRGANCPQLITCRVESVKYQSTPTENYLTVSGRCWGERLFRRVITTTYQNTKGEDIVKNLMDYYVGLSHVRGGTELVESTDTTYTKLEYNDTPVIDVLRMIADSADDEGIIGYDFRVTPDAKFEFFPKNSKTSTVSLADKIESAEYTREITRVRNRITVYGLADKSVPADKDQWTESLTPSGGTWSSISGVTSLDASVKSKGFYSIKTEAEDLYFASCILTLDYSGIVDANQYPTFNLWITRDSSFNGNATIVLYDTNSNFAVYQTTIGTDNWYQIQVGVGDLNADKWQLYSQINWSSINRVQVSLWFSGVSSGSFWVDGLYFGGRRYSNTQNDMASQSSIGLRELVEVNEELASDSECESHAKAQLANLKNPAETLTVKSTVLDYGSTPILAGDKIHVTLPNEGIDGDFRVGSVEYKVNGRTQTLETTLELGRERQLLADYVYALRSRTDRLSRYKTSRR